jgi:DNA helicase IV
LVYDQIRYEGDVLSRGTDEIAREQQYVTMLHGRLDALRARAERRLAGTVRYGVGGTPQNRTERDAAAAEQADSAARLAAAEDGLCFGRLDLDGGERRYVGRIGILDEDDDFEPLLLDWRAPAARPFYTATAAAPDGVRRRRHIRTRMRTVVGVEDDALDVSPGDPSGDPSATASGDGLVGEAALMAAVTAGRTGRMHDVVATIQSEQDRAIRADLRGVLVVQGGPGTGKTAVALHRAAYLLYTHRERLSRRGVLIVGPNPTFLRYIGQVLPGLGETGAVLWTPGELFPGVTARRAEPPRTVEVKGRAVMAEVVAAAVRDRQQVPEQALRIAVGPDEYWLDRTTCLRARAQARRARLPHNRARAVFARHVLDALAAQAVDRLNEDPFAELTRDLADQIAEDLGEPFAAPPDEALLDEQDTAELRRELAEERAVQDAFDRLWPELTPQRLLADLYAAPERLASAAPQLSAADRAALVRAPGGGWSPADVPLLDEAAELLGDVDRLGQQDAELRARQLAYAQGVLDVAEGSRSIDLEDPREEMLTATDMLNAERLADRHLEDEYRTVAQRAAADRKWTFGHVVVDEAQELSAMTWRVLMRRCPSRSMTVVGDVAQTGDPAGASSWAQILEPHVGGRWRMAELTVNYRTPAEVMDLAAQVLAKIDPGLEPPRSVRSSGEEPWRERIYAERFATRVAELARQEERGLGGEGRLAVIVPRSRADEFARAVRRVLPDAAYGDDPDLERRTVVLTVRQAKGLEFDSVIVADPDRIVADAPRGHGDLYVAVTRATRRLGLAEPLPVGRVFWRYGIY